MFMQQSSMRRVVTTYLWAPRLLSKRLVRSAQSIAHRRSSTFYDSDEAGDGKETVLVLGSSGCLGGAICKHLSTQMNMKVIGADIRKAEAPGVDEFIELPTFDTNPGLGTITRSLVEGIAGVLDEDEGIDAIVCASGGWQGDPPFPKADVTEDEFLDGAMTYGATIDKMSEMNVYPVLAAGYAAHRYMAQQGLFVVIGATAALQPTPGMLGYGLSKASVHHFIQSLGESTGKSMASKAKRKKARRLRKDAEYLDTLSAIGILPTTIDTPSNREAISHADFDEWTKPEDIAKEIGTWMTTPELRPHSGSLVKTVTLKGMGTKFMLAR